MIYQELNLVPTSPWSRTSVEAIPRRGSFVDYRALAASARAILKELNAVNLGGERCDIPARRGHR
jgi:hypothetical protein